MANKGVLLFANNDNLETVIKKCNTNFKMVLTQMSQQDSLALQNQEVFEGEIEDLVSQAVGDAVDDLVDLIEDEADTRSQEDQDLEDAIETVDNKFANYTLTTDLARVVLPYSHDDILWVIENNTVGEVMKKTDVSGYTDLVVRCVGEDGNPCYTPLVLIPEDSYQNYTANGKTFKMQINTSDNGRLWWVVPAGKWELWMR